MMAVTGHGVISGPFQLLYAGVTLLVKIRIAEASHNYAEMCNNGLVCPLSPGSQKTVCCQCSSSCCEPDDNPECPFPVWVTYIIIALCAIVTISALVCTCQIVSRRSRAHLHPSQTPPNWRLRRAAMGMPTSGRIVASSVSNKTSSSAFSTDTFVAMGYLPRISRYTYADSTKSMPTSRDSGITV